MTGPGRDSEGSRPRVLVAGVGNVFCGDDGFGVAVAQHLAGAGLPPGVELTDVGIRGVHLAYQLLDGYDLLVLVDAVQRGGEPGTLYVIEHDEAAADRAADAETAPMMDAHDMSPDATLALVSRLGGSIGRVVVVGCEPEDVGAQMDLTPAVERSVEPAARLVSEIVTEAATPSGRAGSQRAEVGRDA